MSAAFSSIHNHHEREVCAEVLHLAPLFPALADDDELLADVACVALNRLPPRYIRHDVDFAFHLSDNERRQSQRRITEAVEFAFAFVQARSTMPLRG